MLVAVAAVLPYKPVFAQTLGFFKAAALAVKEDTAHGTVGVVHLRNAVAILEALVSFFTGHQKKLAYLWIKRQWQTDLHRDTIASVVCRRPAVVYTA